MTRRQLFIFAPAFVSIIFTALTASIINWNATNPLIEIPWLIVLTILNYNLFLITFAACFSFWDIKDKQISEKTLGNRKAVLLYSVKNEEDMYAKLKVNVSANRDALSEVVILSNSTSVACIKDEIGSLNRIRKEFGITASHVPAQPPKHIGIYEFCNKRKDIEYIATCDADTVYPTGSIKQLLRRAYHRDNRTVAIWQSHSIASEGTTRFGRVMGAGQNICAKLYAQGFYVALGESGYYGSGALIKRSAFARAGNTIAQSNVIDVKEIKSHDVWEASILPKLGEHVRYVKSVVTYEQFPQTYVEMINRDRRWMKGTLQSIRALKVLPERNSIATYFVVLNPIMLYLIQPLYLVWIGLGMLRFFGTESDGLMLQLLLITFTLSLVFLQKFLAARSLRDVEAIFVEQLFSTLFYINTPVFTTINLILLNIKEEWIPMAKKVKHNRFVSVINKFMINQIIGYWGILFIYFNINPRALVFFPIFFLFMVSGILSYYFQFEPSDN